ncbi:MAG: leucyl aminopeptidase [Pirellulaceae bacterium]|nr:leucyl aminopeptidase [Pirellulaceae bacterium]
MQIHATNDRFSEIDADAIVLGTYQDSPLAGHVSELGPGTTDLLSQLVESKELTGSCGEIVPLLGPAGIAAPQVLIVGLGKRDKLDGKAAFRAAGAAARKLAAHPRQRVAMYLDPKWSDDTWQAALAGVCVGCQGQDLYRMEKKRHPFGELLVSGASTEILRVAQIQGVSVNLARELVNEPPAAIYPESFADRASQVANECDLEIEIWDESRLAQERCGALLAVARGSAQPPRLVILQYQGASNKKDAPLAFVGKGVTFDSGGLSLKPSDGMLAMKCDMAGAATVLAAVQAIAKLKLPVNVLGVMGLVENMVSGESYKLGDVLTTRNGKTIEVHNTDAEGRLVLADALQVAAERQPAKIIDLATLTGACVVALGNDVVGAMANDQPWCETVIEAAQTCGEPIWQLPMFPEFGEEIKSEVADIKNVGNGRWGGAITAAKLLEEFVNEIPWVHLDIAGPSFLDKAKPWSDGGGTGVMVRTLVEVARKYRA